MPLGPATLLDGRCEAAYGAGAQIPLGHGLTLSAMRHERLLMLCVALPAGSWGVLDLYLKTPKVTTPLNVHASAKLGERALEASGWPQWTWWNENGWASPVVAWSGCAGGGGSGASGSTAGNECRADFAPRGDREIHLDIDRFGSGDWRAMLELHQIRVGADQVSIEYPGAARNDDPTTWSTVDDSLKRDGGPS